MLISEYHVSLNYNATYIKGEIANKMGKNTIIWLYAIFTPISYRVKNKKQTNKKSRKKQNKTKSV